MIKIKSLYIEITDKCNLDCEFCYNRSGRKHPVHEMSVEKIQLIINKFLPMGLEHVSFSGGEPLLHSEWDEIYKIICSYAELNFSVLTNGTINNPYLFTLNKENKNFRIQVSLDGHDEKTNSLIRGKSNYQKTINTFTKLSGGLNRFSVKLVISQLNRHSIEPFVKLALSLNAQPELVFVSNIGNATEKWGDISLTSIEKVRIIKQINVLSDKYDTEIFLPFCSSGCPLDSDDQEANLLIKYDGSMHPCQQLYDEVFCFANAFTINSDEVDSSFDYIRNIVTQRLSKTYNCNNCLARSVCKKGCMAEAYHNNGDYLAADGNCEMRIRQSLEMNLGKIMEKASDD